MGQCYTADYHLNRPISNIANYVGHHWMAKSETKFSSRYIDSLNTTLLTCSHVGVYIYIYIRAGYW